MDNGPSIDDLAEKVRSILVDTLEPQVEIDLSSPLMLGLGFDSLDMIETSFALEEYFQFEFSGRNPIEELDRRIGGGRILDDGILTALGREVLLERMPELGEVELPEALPATQLPQYFSVLPYARLVKDFYDEAPATCPSTGEPTRVEDFRIVSETSGAPVAAPTGDEILESWLETKSAELAAR